MNPNYRPYCQPWLDLWADGEGDEEDIETLMVELNDSSLSTLSTFCVDVFTVQEEKQVGLVQLAKLAFELGKYEGEDVQGDLKAVQDFCTGWWQDNANPAAISPIYEGRVIHEQVVQRLKGAPWWHTDCFIATMFECVEYPLSLFYAGILMAALHEGEYERQRI